MTSTRGSLIGALALGLLVAAVSTWAQPAARTPRIGYLGNNLVGGDPRPRGAFLQGLHDLGYVEGHNVQIEYRDAEGKLERLPALAAELVALKVDVIVTGGGTLGAVAAAHATKTIPVVFAAVGDPVSDGLVASLARPGANVTGLSPLFPELLGKCLELIRQAAPGAGRVAVLLKPDAFPERTKTEILKSADRAARGLGVQLQVVEARRAEDFDRVFSDMSRSRVGALAVLATPAFDGARGRLVDLAAKNRLPTVYSHRAYVDAGGLMSYGPDLADLFRRAATYVDRILKGAQPGDLPVEQATKFELIINLKAAKALGLTIPQSLRSRSEEVIR